MTRYMRNLRKVQNGVCNLSTYIVFGFVISNFRIVSLKNISLLNANHHLEPILINFKFKK